MEGNYKPGRTSSRASRECSTKPVGWGRLDEFPSREVDTRSEKSEDI